jgi:hypothetical protein
MIDNYEYIITEPKFRDDPAPRVHPRDLPTGQYFLVHRHKPDSLWIKSESCAVSVRTGHRGDLDTPFFKEVTPVTVSITVERPEEAHATNSNQPTKEAN